jgi:hypothetical protein
MRPTRLAILTFITPTVLMLAAASALANPPIAKPPSPVGACKTDEALKERCTTEWASVWNEGAQEEHA